MGFDPVAAPGRKSGAVIIHGQYQSGFVHHKVDPAMCRSRMANDIMHDFQYDPVKV